MAVARAPNTKMVIRMTHTISRSEALEIKYKDEN